MWLKQPGQARGKLPPGGVTGNVGTGTSEEACAVEQDDPILPPEGEGPQTKAVGQAWFKGDMDGGGGEGLAK
jgi:hypothetical protein